MHKGITLLTVILVFSIRITLAQNTFSAHGGVNYSSVSSTNSINPDGILGLNVGLGYKYHLGDLGWALIPEFNYSQEGFKTQRLDYLNIPVSIGFDFTNTFNLSAGFQYSMLIGAGAVKDVIHSNNFAFLITLEFFPTEKFVTGLRFANGTKNIIKDPDAAPVQTALTYSIQFYIGVTLFRPSK